MIVYVSDIWVFLLVSVAYIIINYIITVLIGEPTYPFMQWQERPWITLSFTTLLTGISILVYLGQAFAT